VGSKLIVTHWRLAPHQGVLSIDAGMQGWKWMNRLSPTAWTLWGLAGSQLSDRDDVYMTGFTGELISVSDFMDQVFGYTYGKAGRGLAETMQGRHARQTKK